MAKKLTEEQILKRRASQKLYYLKNREKKLAYCKNRYNKNPTKILEQQSNYRAENKDVINAKQRARYQDNKIAIKIKKLKNIVN